MLPLPMCVGSVLTSSPNNGSTRKVSPSPYWALVKTYAELGGYHTQFNVVDRETLLDAQRHPENYKDLVVRLAGFSVFFVELSPQVQMEIISRTEHYF